MCAGYEEPLQSVLGSQSLQGNTTLPPYSKANYHRAVEFRGASLPPSEEEEGNFLFSGESLFPIRL
jgi:hypothetical protein